MRRELAFLTAAVVLGGGFVASRASGQDAGRRFAVTVTNLTRGQQFTPILVASHRRGVSLFGLGQPASSQLATLAEEGDTGPLAAQLESDPGVLDVQVGGGLLDPGASKTVMVATRGAFDHVSAAAMLIPTNDGFFAVNAVKGLDSEGELVLFSVAYDAGSERNDELCSSIPGPFFAECSGPGGGGKPGGGEGFVHINAGVHGIGDMDASARDWRNPVARIAIRRIR